jgi:hypothetical protein
MKKLLALLAVAALGIAIVGCGSGDTSSDKAVSSGIKDKTPKSDDE